MNLKQYICLASLFLPIGTTAQTSNNHIICDFESEDSYTQVGENQWFDAVFPISGNPGAELHKLLVVPDLQSPHNRTSDFLFYIDDIELSTSATPRFCTTYYDINYEKTQKLNRTDRHLNSITLKADGKTQTLKVGQQSTKMLYMPMLEQAFTAKPGQTITATFNYQGTWMSGYVFLDRDNDGQFNVVTDGDNITNDRDLMAYSFFKGKDSSGKTQPDGNRLNPPAFTLPSDLKPGVYRKMLDTEVSVVPGDQVAATASYTGSPMHGYLYVDLDNDGQFTADISENGKPDVSSELLSYTYFNGKNSLGQNLSDADSAGVVLPAFTIPEDLPEGNYRARYKIDWDNANPAGQWTEGGENQIDAKGGYVVDFLLNVHPERSKLDIRTLNGYIMGKGNKGVSETIAYGEQLALMTTPFNREYAVENMFIRHGHNLDGDQFICGNRQWSEDTLEVRNAYTLTKEQANGDVRITLEFEPVGNPVNKLVFSDEFNAPDGTYPDADKWVNPTRYSAAWNRFIAQTEEGRRLTGYIKDGKLVMHCMPNPLETETDRNGQKLDMISGAVESHGKFDFHYGRVEARIKTNPYTGNFPAFWMMPSKQPLGWPNDGEIDIWEQINTENKSYHTIHSKWGNTLGHANDPVKSGSAATQADEYHVFALQWTNKMLTWFVDGKKVFSYAKSKKTDALNNGQWPFDNDFYIILNQSVGNGSWASAPDLGHTYTTLFDWVRVYQQVDPTGIGQTTTSAFDFYVGKNHVRLVAPEKQWVTICSAQGQVMYHKELQGNETVTLPHGVYVINKQKVVIP